MRSLIRGLSALTLAIFCCAIPLPSFAGVFIGITITTPPPPLPVYVQPFVPRPNDIWMPGYWAWGPGGYYWVPGTWVLAPRPGYLWTPGYWGWEPEGYYVWHPGYWGRSVGFYGDIDYGFGYYGRGYVGGAWFGNVFRYNTAVTRVDTTIVRNVYVNRTVIVNNYTRFTRVSYNGGAKGIQARPTAAELAAAREPHLPMTAMQRSHVQTAAQDRNMLSTVNRGAPKQLTTVHPYSQVHQPRAFTPIRAQDRANARPYVYRGRPTAGRAQGRPAPRPTGRRARPVARA
jgi:hypothetical protein